MEIEEIKERVSVIVQLLGGGLIYDADTLPDDWERLSKELAEQARHVMVGGCRLASYAGICAKKAKGR